MEWGMGGKDFRGRTLEFGTYFLQLFRSSERRSSKTSESGCIQPDGTGCNSPVQRAKHTPFLPFENGKNPSGSTEV